MKLAMGTCPENYDGNPEKELSKMILQWEIDGKIGIKMCSMLAFRGSNKVIFSKYL